MPCSVVNSARLAFVDGKGRAGVWTGRSGDVRILGRHPSGYVDGFARDGAVIATNTETDRTSAWPPDGGPSAQGQERRRSI